MKERKRRDSRGSPGSSAGDTATSGQSRFPEGGKEITGTVAALRLDAVLALGFNLSRSRAVLLVKGGLVEVNQRPVENPAYRLDQGDLVSVQGRGRLELAALTGESRKGRQRVKLYKFT